MLSDTDSMDSNFSENTFSYDVICGQNICILTENDIEEIKNDDNSFDEYTTTTNTNQDSRTLCDDNSKDTNRIENILKSNSDIFIGMEKPLKYKLNNNINTVVQIPSSASSVIANVNNISYGEHILSENNLFNKLTLPILPEPLFQFSNLTENLITNTRTNNSYNFNEIDELSSSLSQKYKGINDLRNESLPKLSDFDVNNNNSIFNYDQSSLILFNSVDNIDKCSSNKNFEKSTQTNNNLFISMDNNSTNSYYSKSDPKICIKLNEIEELHFCNRQSKNSSIEKPKLRVGFKKFKSNHF